MTDNNKRNQHILEQLKNRITAAGLLVSLESMDNWGFYLDIPLSDADRTVMKVSFRPPYRMITLNIKYKSPVIKKERILLRLISMLNFDLWTCSYRWRPFMPYVDLSSSFFVANESLDEPSFDLTLHEYVHEGHALSPLLFNRIKKLEDVVEVYCSFMDELDRSFWYKLVKSYRRST